QDGQASVGRLRILGLAYRSQSPGERGLSRGQEARVGCREPESRQRTRGGPFDPPRVSQRLATWQRDLARRTEEEVQGPSEDQPMARSLVQFRGATLRG